MSPYDVTTDRSNVISCLACKKFFDQLTACRYNLQSTHRLSLQRVIPFEAVVVVVSAVDENLAFVNDDEMFGGCLSAYVYMSQKNFSMFD